MLQRLLFGAAAALCVGAMAAPANATLFTVGTIQVGAAGTIFEAPEPGAPGNGPSGANFEGPEASASGGFSYLNGGAIGDSVITFAINPLVFRPADADGHVDPDCCAIPGPFYSVTTTSLTGPSFTMDFLTLESISALGAT